MILFWKVFCIFCYYLGDIASKIGDGRLYQFLMLKSIQIDEKYDLKIWKEVHKPLDES